MSIRILHTSDWHLGKKLYKVERLTEQEAFLKWLIEVTSKEKIDYLLVAGDIFDTPMPPNQALKIYFDFLKEITEKTTAEVIIIAGNHDSGRFLEAPSSILKSHKIHIFGHISENVSDHLISLRKNGSTTAIDLVALPYFRNFEILNLKNRYKLNEQSSTLNVLTALIEEIQRSSSNPGSLKMLLTHHLMGNYDPAGSEQLLALSGVESIPPSLFESAFDHIALGHIHKAQTIQNDSPSIHYSGSPIPLRFSESKNKSIAIMEVTGKGINMTKMEIPVFRPLIVISATHENYLEKIRKVCTEYEKNESYELLPPLLEVNINLSTPLGGIADEIRDVLKESPIELLSVITSFSEKDENNETRIIDHDKALPDIMELFDQFYLTKYPDSDNVPLQIRNDLLELIDLINNPGEMQ